MIGRLGVQRVYRDPERELEPELELVGKNGVVREVTYGKSEDGVDCGEPNELVAAQRG